MAVLVWKIVLSVSRIALAVPGKKKCNCQKCSPDLQGQPADSRPLHEIELFGGYCILSGAQVGQMIASGMRRSAIGIWFDNQMDLIEKAIDREF